MSVGPLYGVRVLEFAGVGPAPFGVMLLADLGADVVRVDRDGGDWPDLPIVSRNRAAIVVDLKAAEGVDLCLAAIDKADVLIEGYRPGVMERLGLGPDIACARNPRLVYARMTGWGQEGPLAGRAGHDINYIAVAGALGLLGGEDAVPDPPLNLLGDYAGGGLYLALGVVSALFERERSGLGQIVDAAIVDGAASLLGPILGIAASLGSLESGRDLLGGKAPHYRSYRCADGRYVAVGALEPRFRAELCRTVGIDEAELKRVEDPREWPRATLVLERVFAERSRDEWAALAEASDACLSPVLSPAEAAVHPHMRERGVYVEADGLTQPAPAPRLSRTPGTLRRGSPDRGEGGAERLASWGVALA